MTMEPPLLMYQINLISSRDQEGKKQVILHFNYSPADYKQVSLRKTSAGLSVWRVVKC